MTICVLKEIRDEVRKTGSHARQPVAFLFENVAVKMVLLSFVGILCVLQFGCGVDRNTPAVSIQRFMTAVNAADSREAFTYWDTSDYPIKAWGYKTFCSDFLNEFLSELKAENGGIRVVRFRKTRYEPGRQYATVWVVVESVDKTERETLVFKMKKVNDMWKIRSVDGEQKGAD